MSLEVWYAHEPVEPKYLQISHNALDKFCKSTGKDFDAFRDKIHEHHAQPVTKDGMFVFEQFFSRSPVLVIVAEYLKSEGYTVKNHYLNLEGECIVEGYDGILVNWSW